MDRGRDFLRAQVSNAVMQHKTLLENLQDHAKEAHDARYRDLCTRHIAGMQQHQQALEQYRATLGEESGGGAKELLGSLLGKARDAVDAVRDSDFLRIVGDIVTIRQAQDNAACFAAVGERIGEPQMSALGRQMETAHDTMQREFNALVREMFVEHVKAAG
jgi:predicted outer membrane protein